MIFFKSEPDVEKRLLPKKSAKKRRLLHSVAFKLIFCRKKLFQTFHETSHYPVCALQNDTTLSTWKYKEVFFCTMTPYMHNDNDNDTVYINLDKV